ncbi:bifunctional folylpolyglutamate synthase/dihydrofolate synthase [Clostridia bacterium]|nr:bifunctional folylpolyglutamate synthase/dihydrofolate synthase [Clostridia bacterium]
MTENAIEAVNYLNSVDFRGSRLGLDRLSELLSKLGEPQKRLKFIHVAGTNGKGSTCAMLASILRQAGYKTGLYTSPYVQTFHERIQIDGVMISDAELTRLTERIRKAADAMADHPTSFEMITALGFLYFSDNNCDIVVLETGLGGRLDATNVIGTPLLAVITNIGMDHMEQLGGTLELIAAEKAGIIKSGGDVVLYGLPASVARVFEDACRERGANLVKADFSGTDTIRVPLRGAHQQRNAAVVLTAVGVLRRKGFTLSDDNVAAGLANVFWPARFEVLRENPAVIVDGGHNVQCVESVVAGLKLYYPDERAAIVMGVMADKDVDGMLNALKPVAGRFFAVASDTSRAMPPEALAARAAEAGFEAPQAFSGIRAGLDAALSTGGTVCALGSLYIAQEIRAAFL